MYFCTLIFLAFFTPVKKKKKSQKQYSQGYTDKMICLYLKKKIISYKNSLLTHTELQPG